MTHQYEIYLYVKQFLFTCKYLIVRWTLWGMKKQNSVEPSLCYTPWVMRW
jgi:hypothetical protein